jgi:uncharacterized protein (TIGR00369 family)
MPARRRTSSNGIVKARRRLGGLALFRKMMAGEVPRPPMTSLLNLRLLEAEEGRVVFGAVPARSHYNGMGIVHGALAAALLDSALGCAVNTMAPPGKIFTTLEMKINFTRPLTREVGPVRCDASVLHMGRRVATAEGRVVDKRGVLYAHGTATCILFLRSSGPAASRAQVRHRPR